MTNPCKGQSPLGLKLRFSRLESRPFPHTASEAPANDRAGETVTLEGATQGVEDPPDRRELDAELRGLLTQTQGGEL